jgi:hypothetical protein
MSRARHWNLSTALAWCLLGLALSCILLASVKLRSTGLLSLTPVHWLLLSLLASVALLIGFASASLGSKRSALGSPQWWGDVSAVTMRGLATELIGAALTFVLLEVVVDVSQREQETAREKERLVRQLGSTDNRFSLQAREALNGYGWLDDGTLRGATLIDANMKGINLSYADLTNTALNWANLSDANLMGAELVGANLFASDLTGALLAYSDLRGACHMGADLTDASVVRADLRGAYLFQANLEGVTLQWTAMDENTILPDGRTWDLTVDMDIYVRPDQ